MLISWRYLSIRESQFSDIMNMFFQIHLDKLLKGLIELREIDLNSKIILVIMGINLRLF